MSGSGPVDGLAAHIEEVTAVWRGLPDHRWHLQGLVVEGTTVARRG